MTYRCRTILPTVSAWAEQDGVSPEAAAAEYWFATWRNGQGAEFRRGPGSVVSYARVEVEGHGSMVARVFESGLARRGGVPRKHPPTLADVATAIGWKDDPADLLAEGWECEETPAEAMVRKWER